MGRAESAPKAHIVLDRTISLPDAKLVIDGATKIALHPEALARCAASHARLQQVIAEDRHVYGLTTGFGPLANRLVDKIDGAALQQNLVYHLASGVGPEFDWLSGRAVVFARLMSILQGASGASEAVISGLVTLMNSEFSPCLPSQGTVGASGDLTPLAHMVLCFQGRGAFRNRAGDRLNGLTGLTRIGVRPFDLARRDGLALVNGTSAMTGLAVLNADLTTRSIGWSIALTAALAETQMARVEAWHPAFSELRPHERQADAASELLKRLVDSHRIVRTHLADRQLTMHANVLEARAGQDAYTLRCAPQVIGAVWDMLDWHDRVVETELSSVTDNPIFPPQEGDHVLVLHGGNFMGQHVGLASDALANAVCVLAGLAERQLARLTDETLNNGLPAFLHEGAPGLNSGLMGAQVTATALLAEMRTVGAAGIQSISTNGANQDVVSMGTISARAVRDKLQKLMRIQAILGLAVAQAIDLRSSENPKLAFSVHAIALRDFMRQRSPRLTKDRPLGGEIEAIADVMATNAPPNV
ncbi:aromatic amino acid ammonia-lyase [Cognatiyoonia sp. IB215446]|uniref:HAL/PAL/TAL family ammonia-lyase n=1 Tax=Cognatiyoonia sp. IB215446 TaxID=3097355 RepID=UPI002A17B00E|nr:aromatic amino acid ammonia-lyase [Cognatiyoonia sp. IB215446]MDX8348461.1 aromatic amino acid ammonia-lyase [Cognatiyoonia sp. IB215446]